MRRLIVGILLAAGVTLGGTTAAWSLTPEEDAILKNFRNEQAEQAFQNSPPGRASRLTGQTTPPPNCIGTVGAMTPGADAVTVTVRRNTPVSGYASSFDLTYWRTACTGDSSKSAVLVRVSNMVGGKAFICGGSFKTTQGGITWDTTALLTSGTGLTTWCNELYSAQTFVVGQWSYKDQYDSQAAFGVYYDFVFHDVITANVPAYSGGSTTPTNPAAGTPYYGWWYNAIQGGRGWGIGKHASSDKLYLGGFLYASNGDPNWVVSTLSLVSSGSVSVNGVTTTSSYYQGSLIYCRDGQPLEMTTAKPPTCTTSGTVELQINGARAARLTISRSGFSSAMVTDLVPFDSF